MRSISTLAATAAALLPLVAAVPDPNTIQVDFTKRKVDAKTSPLRSRLARRQTVNSAISNQIIGYFINVEVGTPGQNITLQLDTGSSDIWFPSSDAQYCQSYQGGCINTYDESASSSAVDATDLGDFSISYVDGTQISGSYIQDTLNIGGSTTLTNLTMASATDTSLAYGIMGVGFDKDESILGGLSGAASPYPNVIDVLKSEGKINARAYSLWLDDLDSSTGSILFGGVDSDKYTGDLIAVPIQKDSTSLDYTSFSVAWTGLSVTGSKQNSNLSPSTPQSVILDSGTTDLYLPDDIANNILQGVGAVSDSEVGNLVPCSLRNDDLSFAFQFGGSNGPKINVPLGEFVVDVPTTSGQVPKFESGPYSGQDACLFGIFAAGDIPLLFGDTFMRSAYIVYDLDNLEIGLAQANTNGNSGTGNVKAFSASTGPIPGAKTTVTDVQVTQTFSGSEQPGIIQSTATGVGQETAGGSPTFALVTGAAQTSSGSSSGSSHSNAAGAVSIPSTQRSTFAVVGVTLAAFLFGAMLL